MSYKSSKRADDITRPKGTTSLSGHTRKHSTSSSSDYSYDSDAKDAESEPSTRRITIPSKGGADRRRVAIMQMDSPSLRSRRGHRSDLTGLALVAPPDAAPRAYNHITPTTHTPRTPTNPPRDHDPLTLNLDDNKSKDISTTKDPKDNNDLNLTRVPGSPRPRPQSPSRGLLNTPHTSHLPSNHSPMFSPITPDIGQGKDIHTPVAGPVVVNLSLQSRKAPSATTSRTVSPLPDSLLGTPVSSTSSFLHYQPGVHSTAGPLPPPPRANFNIDIHNPPPPRPPRLNSPAPTRTKRDLDAVKQNLQLPPSVTAVLSSKSSSLTTTSSHKEDPSSDISSELKGSSSDLSTAASVHRREGALSSLEDIPAEPPSMIVSESTTTKPLESSNIENKETTVLEPADIPSVTVVEPPSQSKILPAEIDHHKFSEWLKSNPELSQPLEIKRRGHSVDEAHRIQKPSGSPERSMSPELRGSGAPSPPPKSFRNSFTTNLKRLSLPRTASLSSKSGRWSAGGTRTPSPSLHHVSPPPQFKKMRSTNPAALLCYEVYSQRTTSERCLIYATKINELYLYDCGLSEWVINMKSRGPNTQNQNAVAKQPFAPQPRHTSGSSMVSEATFPTRPDASTATDLSPGAYGDITPTAISLTLPYPSLAMNPPPSRSNSSVGTPSSSIRSLAPSASISRTGGFFSSLGRKTSLSRKDRQIAPPSSSSGSLSSASGSGRFLSASSKHTAKPSVNMNISRPINITTLPTIPGGPRAPFRRPQRSQTFTPSFPPASVVVNNELGRRPSLFDLKLDPVIDIRADTEFYQQVDKLASVLPRANRDVLAGYLRRAGQDMLAIGQYLEDEKNGTIQLYD